eukprot:COSAG06_NODE_2642_length_6517_cov_33.378778_2_plen_75_part_00
MHPYVLCVCVCVCVCVRRIGDRGAPAGAPLTLVPKIDAPQVSKPVPLSRLDKDLRYMHNYNSYQLIIQSSAEVH